ncbi:MAG: hypothetical protein HC837_14655 [Chloroflexaceae bacterium]|nr:hypothetical protein [Chloroflexaceae bacterium]
MEIVPAAILIGFIGWVATVGAIMNTSSLSVWNRRILFIFTWMLWMIPAFDASVYQGLLNARTAVMSCISLTIGLMVLVSLTAIVQRGRSKS